MVTFGFLLYTQVSGAGRAFAPSGFTDILPVAVAPGTAYTTAIASDVKREQLKGLHMADDETPDADAVVVVESDDDDTPDVETGDTTVIVDAKPEESAPVIDDFTERFVRLETRLEAIEAKQFEFVTWRESQSIAEDVAEDALEVALVNDESIADQVDDAIVDTIEDTNIVEGEDGEDELEVDNEPESAKIHILFRPAKDLFKRN